MIKWIAISLGVLLLLTNGFWVYSAIDLAATEKYRQQEEYENRNRIKALTKLNGHFVKGMSKEKLTAILKEQFPDSEPFEKEGALNTLWLSFKLNKEGKVK